MGTPDFAVPVLEALAKEHNIVAVYTRAPKESGRGKKVNKTPVHLLAEAKGLEVRTPKSLRNEDEQLSLKALGGGYGDCRRVWFNFAADCSGHFSQRMY